MHQKKIIVFSPTAELEIKIRKLVEGMEAEVVSAGMPLSHLNDWHIAGGYDLVVAQANSSDITKLSELEGSASDEGEFSLLLVVNEDNLASLRVPVQIFCDFVCDYARDAEMIARIRRLLWPGEESGENEFIRQGNLTLNLATYQVKISGEPVDFTYLEYALLAFLITHPGRTYSRDALLNRVWDFDYYGGSRTVDVHVRRIRAKLGPDLAQHLKTIRGVGYLWSY